MVSTLQSRSITVYSTSYTTESTDRENSGAIALYIYIYMLVGMCLHFASQVGRPYESHKTGKASYLTTCKCIVRGMI